MVPDVHTDLLVHYMENQGKVLADDSADARSSSSTCVLWALAVLSLRHLANINKEKISTLRLVKFILLLINYSNGIMFLCRTNNWIATFF